MVFASFLTQNLPLVLAYGALASLSVWWLWLPQLALVGLLASLIVGQTWRVALPGQGGGILISDVAVILVVAAALFSRRTKSAAAWRWCLLMLPFISWSLLTLIVTPLYVARSDWLVGAAYWLRLTTHLLLFPALIKLLSVTSFHRVARRGLVLALSVLVLLGFLQLWLLPNLVAIGGGWDPHERRLVSTWLDPNFFGGLLAVSLPWLMGLVLTAPSGVSRIGSWLGVGALSVALLLTASRSSILALGTATLVVVPLAVYQLRARLRAWIAASSHWLFIMSVGVSALVASVVLTVTLLGGRAWGLFWYDPTVELRLNALARVWELARAHPFTGVGYNLYQFVALQTGLIGDFSIHSRAGADNSLLTLFVTTGLPGIVLFLLPWLSLTGVALRRSRSLASIGLLGTLLVWLVHSQFVNSLLYAHTMIAVMLISALVITQPRVSL